MTFAEELKNIADEYLVPVATKVDIKKMLRQTAEKQENKLILLIVENYDSVRIIKWLRSSQMNLNAYRVDNDIVITW